MSCGHHRQVLVDHAQPAPAVGDHFLVEVFLRLSCAVPNCTEGIAGQDMGLFLAREKVILHRRRRDVDGRWEWTP